MAALPLPMQIREGLQSQVLSRSECSLLWLRGTALQRDAPQHQWENQHSSRYATPVGEPERYKHRSGFLDHCWKPPRFTLLLGCPETCLELSDGG